MQIYLARNNQQAGPYTLEQLNQMLASQQVLLTDLMWHQGMTEWKAVGERTNGQFFYQPATELNKPAPFSNEARLSSTSPSATAAPIKTSSVVNAQVKHRIFAKFIDLGLYIIPQIVVLMLFIPHDLLSNTASLGMAEQMKIAKSIQNSLPNWVPYFLLIYTFGLLLLQNILIGRSGQSIGKKAFNLQIVDVNNHLPVGQWRGFFVRSFLLIMLSQLLGIAPLIILIFIADIILFFGKGNNSLHDRLAKTKVIYINKK